MYLGVCYDSPKIVVDPHIVADFLTIAARAGTLLDAARHAINRLNCQSTGYVGGDEALDDDVPLEVFSCGRALISWDRKRARYVVVVQLSR